MTTVLVGNQIELARLLTLRAGIELEGKGLRRRGRSCLAIVKSEFGWKGNRAKILARLSRHIELLTWDQVQHGNI
ncbi:hypothetical protein CMI37_34715 [Candidatus Pacearchaeota archaeon]|nr:hypothetical protein [Candidatus Pacearchaeota archaeon]